MKEAGLPDGVFNVLQGDRIAVSGLLEHPDVAALSFVGSTPAAKVHLRDRCPSRQACPSPRWRQEPHDRAARCRHRPGTADAAVSAGYGSAGERCMAIATVVTVGDVHDPLIEAIKQRLPSDHRRRRHQARSRHGATGHREASRQGRLVPRQQCQHRVPRWWPMVVSTRSTRTATASTWVSRCIDDVTPEMDAYKDRDLRPGPDRGARRHVRGGTRLDQRAPATAMARPSSRVMAARRGSSSSTSTSGWWV